MGVALCAITSGVVFIVNLALTVWVGLKYGLEDGFGTIQHGHCKETKDLSLWLHVIINGLSTILLSASNCTMQCLASPTREEIDYAHRRGMWLDIGVPSMRNLSKISRTRVIIWVILVLSSVPLHLLYNSAIFSTLAVQEYSVFATSSDLLNRVDLNWSSPVKTSAGPALTLQDFRNASEWDKLENEQCIEAYGQRIVSARGNLLAVSSAVNASKLLLEIANTYGNASYSSDSSQAYDWICYDHQADRPVNYSLLWCDPSAIVEREQAPSWTITDIVNGTNLYQVEYCLSRPVEKRCKVQFSFVIMGVVIVCNLVKMLCMLFTSYYLRSQPLVTIGDAIASFLQRIDPATKHMCIAGKMHFEQKRWKRGPLTWANDTWSWHSTVSFRRWWICDTM